MVSTITPDTDTDTGSTGTDETGNGSTPLPTSLATVAANLQQGFNTNHIEWNSINWGLFTSGSPNAVPEYSLSHDINTINVFIPRMFADTPEYTQVVDAFGEPVTTPVLDDLGAPVLDDAGNPRTAPVYESDAYGNPIRIVDSAKDLFLAIGGTDGSDHLRNRDYTFNSDNNGGQRDITGAFMGFSGDDVLYSDNLSNPMLMGGSGDDDYIIETSTTTGNFTQIVEHGGDLDDSIISYDNDWSFALDINAQHLLLVDSTQAEMIVIWDYYVPDAKIENFWFDFDNNGLNEHYSHEEFTAKVQANDFWLGSFSPEALGISSITMNDLNTATARAVTLSNQVENLRIAGTDTARSIAQLYQTAFDRTPDTPGLNFWIDQWETNDLSLGQIAEGFYNSDEFNVTYGNLSDTDYISQLYANVLNRTPDEGGAAHWLNEINLGRERADVMKLFSESLENQINTELQLGGLQETTPGEWALL